MTQIRTTLQIAVSGGPSWSINSTEDVEAYDVIDITIDAHATDVQVQVQPAAAARVNVLAIQSSLYGDEITYKASDGANDTAAVKLLGPQVFGRGVTSLFGLDVLSLKFSNAHPAGSADKQARIQILVGRDATP